MYSQIVKIFHSKGFLLKISLVLCLVVLVLFANTRQSVAKSDISSTIFARCEPGQCYPIGPGKSELSLYRPGGSDLNIPYVISPRYTKITQTMPELRWHDTGLESYKVQICDLNGLDRLTGLNCKDEEKPIVLKRSRNFYSIKKFHTEIAVANYPDISKPLLENEPYLLIVKGEDNNLVSSANEPGIDINQYYRGLDRGIGKPGIRFLVASLENSKEQPSTATKVLSQKLVRESYYGYAINLLEQLENLYKGVELYEVLGDLYAESGLNCMAKGAYSEAFKMGNAQDRIRIKESQLAVDKMMGIAKDSKDLSCTTDNKIPGKLPKKQVYSNGFSASS
jgi:hypothetical protein